MSMYKVPSEAIKSVRFGCKSISDFIENVTLKLKKSNMNHIELFKSSVDKFDYRLKFEEEKI